MTRSHRFRFGSGTLLAVLSASTVFTVSADTGGGWENWVESLTPEQLCAAYLNGIIGDEDLPGGRASDPCPEGATAKEFPW